ncbi:MAG: hypothetical protein ABI761_14325 [Saprospiraceae bacterium]
MNRMQNKSSMLSSIKQREDAGWIKLHQQLDVDLPVKKDRNRKFFWIFLLGGLSLGALLWTNRTFRSSSPKTGIQNIISIDSSNNIPDSKNTIENKNVNAITEQNTTSKQVDEKLIKENSLATNRNVKSESIKSIAVVASEDKINARDKGKSKHQSVASLIKNSQSDIKKLQESNTSIKSTNKDVDILEKGSIRNATSEEVVDNKIITNHESSVQNQSTYSRNLILVNPLESKNLIQSAFSKGLPIVSLANSTDFQKTNTLVDLKKSKPSLWFVQGAGTLQDGTYLSSSFAPGISIHLGSKWTINTFMGIGYQFSSNKGTPVNSGNNTLLGSTGNLDAKNAPVYSQASTQIFLDKSNSLTRLSNGVLYISSSDQVLYTQAAHFNLMGQTSLSYALNSRWFIESGIYIHKALSKNYNQIIIQSSSINNGAFAQSGASRFNVYTRNIPLEFHFNFQAGYRLNKKIDVSLSYSPRSFSTSYPGNNLLYDASPSSVPQPSSVSTFVLPNKDGTSFVRFAIRYHL